MNPRIQEIIDRIEATPPRHEVKDFTKLKDSLEADAKELAAYLKANPEASIPAPQPQVASVPAPPFGLDTAPQFMRMVSALEGVIRGLQQPSGSIEPQIAMVRSVVSQLKALAGPSVAPVTPSTPPPPAVRPPTTFQVGLSDTARIHGTGDPAPPPERRGPGRPPGSGTSRR